MNAERNVTTHGKPARIEIARDGVVPIRDARGMLLTVQQGGVWITQSGSPVDVCLYAGESFRVEHDGLTLVSAIAPVPLARVTLTPPDLRPSAITRFAGGFASWWGSRPQVPMYRSSGSV